MILGVSADTVKKHAKFKAKYKLPFTLLADTEHEIVKAYGVWAQKSMFGKKKSNRAAGTKSYMSPEQIRGDWLDGRADVYSFGATCYEVVTGRPPFRANSPNELLAKHLKEPPVLPQTHEPEITDECSKLVMQLLEKDKKNRPKDFHVFLSQFRGIRVFRGDKLELAGKSQM